MTAPTINFAGGEDSEFTQFGGGTVDTTSGRYRSAYARCDLHVPTSAGGGNTYWQSNVNVNLSQAWIGHRCYMDVVFTQNNYVHWGLVSSDNVLRLAIEGTGTNSQFKVVKINAAGTVTQLGSAFTMLTQLSVDKFDVNVNYNTSGFITIYLNGVQVFTYSGDVTTDSITAWSFIRLGCGTGGGGTRDAYWSEIIISQDTDTRSLNLQTLAPVANGNTHNFDTSSPAAANVNETTLNDATVDASSTAGQIDEYTIPSITAGTFIVVAMGVSARMQKGVSGPSKADLGVRSGSTDYWSSDQSLTTTFGTYQNWWNQDPNTSATWTGLPVNIGLKSVT